WPPARRLDLQRRSLPEHHGAAPGRRLLRGLAGADRAQPRAGGDRLHALGFPGSQPEPGRVGPPACRLQEAPGGHAIVAMEDIYPLSPMQKGMLFHTLLTPETGVYFEQHCWGVRGEIHAEALRRAWQHVADRHPVLRTSFDWEQLDRPMQLVHRRVEAAGDQKGSGPLSTKARRIRTPTFFADGPHRRASSTI